MSIRNWFKGRRRGQETESTSPSEELITVFDERGRELRIERRVWRDDVLLPHIEQAWNDPDALYQHVVLGLQDGFARDLLSAAERLVEVDGASERARVVLAVTRMQVGDIVGAERELEACMAQHGRTGVAVTNLAKVHAEAGDDERSVSTLREALEIEPNQDNALLWWAALARDRGGEEAYVKALEEVASVRGSWRPQLWIARELLGRGEVARAAELYEYVLARARDEAGVLMMVSGDLGNAGALGELVRIVGPHYDPERHGPEAGMNLTEALRELGKTDEALSLVRRVQALGLAPFTARLSELEREIATGAAPRPAVEEPEIVALPVEGPLWTRGLYDPDWLLPARPEEAPALTFFALADESARGELPLFRASDAAGRTTRAIPLYLAEAFVMRYAVRATCMLFVAKGTGPAVFGAASDVSSLAPLASDCGVPRVVVGGSLTEARVLLNAWDASTRQPLAAVEIERRGADDGSLTAALLDALVSALTPAGFLRTESPPDYYGAPDPEQRHGYASALEQLTYQLLVVNDLVPPSSLWNERGFFETYFDLVERWPNETANARLIAICGVVAGALYSSSVVAPYRKIALGWLDEAPRGGVIDRLAPAVYKRLGEEERLGEWLKRAPQVADERYGAWLERVQVG